MRAADRTMFGRGESIRLTPPASVRSHSLARRLVQARWRAVYEDEQAVSTAMQGPCRPNV